MPAGWQVAARAARRQAATWLTGLGRGRDDTCPTLRAQGHWYTAGPLLGGLADALKPQDGSPAGALHSCPTDPEIA